MLCDMSFTISIFIAVMSKHTVIFNTIGYLISTVSEFVKTCTAIAVYYKLCVVYQAGLYF
eukprot:SAG11_NODE_343_length_10455_cov_7.072036_9_plen_60_part_00